MNAPRSHQNLTPLPSLLAAPSGVQVRSNWNPDNLLVAGGALLVLGGFAWLIREYSRS